MCARMTGTPCERTPGEGEEPAARAHGHRGGQQHWVQGAMALSSAARPVGERSAQTIAQDYCHLQALEEGLTFQLAS